MIDYDRPKETYFAFMKERIAQLKIASGNAEEEDLEIINMCDYIIFTTVQFKEDHDINTWIAKKVSEAISNHFSNRKEASKIADKISGRLTRNPEYAMLASIITEELKQVKSRTLSGEEKENRLEAEV